MDCVIELFHSNHIINQNEVTIFKIMLLDQVDLSLDVVSYFFHDYFLRLFSIFVIDKELFSPVIDHSCKNSVN